MFPHNRKRGGLDTPPPNFEEPGDFYPHQLDGESSWTDILYYCTVLCSYSPDITCAHHTTLPPHTLIKQGAQWARKGNYSPH